jgi:hypothetical protein
MSMTRSLIGVAISLFAFVAITATASAKFVGTKTTGKVTGGQAVLTLANGKAMPNVKCTTSNGTYIIQKEGSKQEPVLEGNHLQLILKLEGKPKANTKLGACDLNFVESGTVEAEVKQPVELQIQQTLGATTKLLVKLDQDVSIGIVGAACKIFIPSKSNQNLGKTSIANSEKNILEIKLELVGDITTEAIGAGCAAGGLSDSATGSFNLEPPEVFIAEGVKEV